MRPTFLNPNRIKLGMTPTSWWNDDFPNIEIGIPYEQCLSEIALAGFSGTSNSPHWPEQSQFQHALRMRGLVLSEPWTSLYFTVKEKYDETIEEFTKSMMFIKEMGGTDIVVAEFGYCVQLTDQPLKNRPIFTDTQWDALTKGLETIGQIAKDNGMRVCYHHHMGTGVETRADVDRLMASTKPDLVTLLLDSGHLRFAGDDPVAMARAYADRIKHVHLKSVRLPVLEQANANGWSFKTSILNGIFTVPGDPEGGVFCEGIFEVLADSDFKGWLVVEAEQDPAKAEPLKYAKMARAYIKETAGI